MDRRVIITGAGSGIGQATVARLLDEGATVVAFDISEDGLAQTVSAAADAGTDKRLTTAVLDISDEQSVASSVGFASMTWADWTSSSTRRRSNGAPTPTSTRSTTGTPPWR